MKTAIVVLVLSLGLTPLALAQEGKKGAMKEDQGSVKDSGAMKDKGAMKDSGAMKDEGNKMEKH
jgi:hypothetical protein